MTGIARELLTDQQTLWDAQHAQRGGTNGLEDVLADVPNASAVLLGQLVRPRSVIAEVGSANGRDARYWARNGHRVRCMDFSRIALGQLVERTERQGLTDFITPLHFDANDGKLPDEVGTIDAFYARSALHVDDETLMSLLSDVDSRLKKDGIVLIEGKSTTDRKIRRSVDIGNGLAVDPEENGHMRRVWTPESLEDICSGLGWTALQQETAQEQWAGTDATFLRLVATK